MVPSPGKDLKAAATALLSPLSILVIVGCPNSESRSSSHEVDSAAHFDTMSIVPDTLASEPAGWSLDLVLSRPVVRLGEPVYLIARLTNGTMENGQFPDLLSPDFGFMTILIRRPGDSEDASYRPPIRREGRGKPLVEVPPGGSVSTAIPIYYGREGWFLEREGLYEIRAILRWEDLHLNSRSVQLRVKPPDGERERIAAMRFMSVGRFHVLGGGDEVGEQALRDLAAGYPGTPWAGYAGLALVLSSRPHPAGEDASASCPRTVERLRSTLPQIEDPVAAVEGYAALAECLQIAGRTADADRVLTRFVQRYPEVENLPGVLERLERVSRRP